MAYSGGPLSFFARIESGLFSLTQGWIGRASSGYNGHCIRQRLMIGVRGTKYRYTDFLVNEILPDGRVLRLRELKPRKTQVPGNTRTDRESLPDPVQQLPSEKPPLDDSQNVGGDVGGDAGLERAEQGHIDPKSANGTASASPLSDEVSSSMVHLKPGTGLLNIYLGLGK